MKMFIGRERELSALNNAYASGTFGFAVIYGRRRVGKTALINEFIKDKDVIYFTGVESNATQNLENLSKSIAEYNTLIPSHMEFPSFQTALEYVFKLAETKQIVLVLDEYPYVARSSESLSSILQFLIDKNKDTSKLFLIICGSSMSYMEDHVLAYKAPLYGRRTLQMKVEPFDFFDSSLFFTKLSNEDRALSYGMVGGTPLYLAKINENISMEKNIKEMFLDQSAFFYEETTNLLKQEVREPAVYTAIITAVAGGNSKLSEIASRINEETSVCATYIRSLVNLGIIKKEVPYGETAQRKTIYSIRDNMFRFWYRFVLDNTSLIERGASDLVYSRIEPELSTYMGAVFEEICTQYLWALLLRGESPVFFKNLGRWWGTDPRTREQEEIDIMGDDKDCALFAECKWKNEKLDSGVLETLIRRGDIFPYKKKYYFLFSKSGFTEGVINKAGMMGNVTLVKFDEMFESLHKDTIHGNI